MLESLKSLINIVFNVLLVDLRCSGANATLEAGSSGGRNLAAILESCRRIEVTDAAVGHSGNFIIFGRKMIRKAHA